MSTPRLPTRDAIQRLAELTERYRIAFSEVQDCLAAAEMGRIPAWVFAIDRLKMEEVNALSPQLAIAESRRRSLKVAMHALVEFIALEDEGEGHTSEPTTEEVAHLMSAMEEQEVEAARGLDRFISVVNYAKAGNCIFINGTFEPVIRGSATSAPAAPRAAKQNEPVEPVPQGDDIALPEPDVQITMPPKA